MKPVRPFLVGAYGVAGFALAFLCLFWLLFRWLHWGYTKWLVDSGDWVIYDGSFSILFGVLLAAIPFSADIACSHHGTIRRQGLCRALLWLVAAVVFFGPCFCYQRHLQRAVRPEYPDILVWPVLYFLAAATGAVVLTGWAVGQRRRSQGGEEHAA